MTAGKEEGMWMQRLMSMFFMCTNKLLSLIFSFKCFFFFPVVRTNKRIRCGQARSVTWYFTHHVIFSHQMAPQLLLYAQGVYRCCPYRARSVRFAEGDGERNDEGEAGFVPHLTSLYLLHEQASTLLQSAFSFGRKVRAAPTNRKGSIRPVWRKTLSLSSIVSKRDLFLFCFVFRRLFQNKTR